MFRRSGDKTSYLKIPNLEKPDSKMTNFKNANVTKHITL